MLQVDKNILDINKVICRNIENLEVSGRGLISQNVISQLRNLVEHVALKDFGAGNDISNSYKNIQDAILHIKSRGNLKFLNKFHKLLQISASHYTLDEENSERLMLKYFEYLIRIKEFLENKYSFYILENLQSFPVQEDSVLKEYYEKIAEKVKRDASTRGKSNYSDRYYIQKIKPFFVGLSIFYEVTFTRADDKVSKFDRIIAFTKLEICHNYAVKLSVSRDYINILGKEMPIQIIDNWEASVRPCELSNFADLFGSHPKLGGNKEYYELMRFITKTGNNFVDLIDFQDSHYEKIKEIVASRSRVQHFFKILDKCRNLSKNRSQGANIVRYLLYSLNNKIIKKQRNNESCGRLSGLFLYYGCIPFDDMPFNSSLINHNPKFFHLIDCIDAENRVHELFARFLRNNTEIKGNLYTPIKTIEHFENIDKLIEQYNQLLYYKHQNRQIEKYKNHLFINGYEKDTHEIIYELKKLSASGIRNYKNSVLTWLQNSSYVVDCPEKSTAIAQLFESSRVALIYGAAGTGKSTMINHISNFFNDKVKLYLANTNPAVDNLKRKVNAAGCDFKTITKFLSPYNHSIDYDVLIVDECSTVSNANMLAVLRKASFKLLVLVGDVYQIESIRFGNWFSLAKSFISSSSIFELTKPYRSSNEDLLLYWERVRNIEDNILELSSKKNYSTSLDESIFDSFEEDEIILCLNYDGLYGINNINKFLQGSNSSPAIDWGVHTYKVNDPILFNENERFSPVLYNNLKGRIRDIEILNNKIQFDIEVFSAINEFDIYFHEIELIENSQNGNPVIRFQVNKYASTDEDDSPVDTIVPFQVAYAVSIHKAQGLEYNSVKIVITDEVDEMITHNIFYTAITRARKKLRIYWSPESENKILGNLKTKFNAKDVALLRSKYGLN